MRHEQTFNGICQNIIDYLASGEDLVSNGTECKPELLKTSLKQILVAKSSNAILKRVSKFFKELGLPENRLNELIDQESGRHLEISTDLRLLQRSVEKGLLRDIGLHKDKPVDRRRETRYAANADVSFNIGENWSRGGICDISKSGAQVLAYLPVDSKDTTKVRIQNYQNYEKIDLLGTVVWQEEINIGNYNSRFGFHFNETLASHPTCFVPRTNQAYD